MAAKSNTVLLGPDDQKNYELTITNLAAQGLVPANVRTNEIVQLFRIGGTYVGAWMILDGPMIARSSGAEPSWRKYIFVTEQWGEHIFENIGNMYDYLAEHFPMHLRKYHYLRLRDNTFQNEAVATLDMSLRKARTVI